MKLKDHPIYNEYAASKAGEHVDRELKKLRERASEIAHRIKKLGH